MSIEELENKHGDIPLESLNFDEFYYIKHTKLSMLVSSNPKDIVPDEWKEESINYLWGEVDNLMNEYTTYHKDLIKFEYCLANYPSKVND